MNLGFVEIALAIQTLWSCPPLSSWAYLSKNSTFKPTSTINFSSSFLKSLKDKFVFNFKGSAIISATLNLGLTEEK